MNIKTFSRKAEEAATLLKNLANANRLMILCHLHKGECCVCELEDKLGLTQSALSQHLARLRNEGLVRTRREAQNIFYSLSDPHAACLIETLSSLFCPPTPQSKRKSARRNT